MNTPAEAAADHETSLAIWDVPSPVVAGDRATLKIGITCSRGCNLTGTRIDVYDETGALVFGTDISSGPWPETDALYWADCGVAAPATEGEHAWHVRASVPDAKERSQGVPVNSPSHPGAASVLRFVVSRPPEHQLTIEVVEKGSGQPVGGVELRVGRFRAATTHAGVALVHVPGGVHGVSAWKAGYELLSTTIDVAGDATVRLEVAAALRPEQPYWM
jgi:hypothetical protein